MDYEFDENDQSFRIDNDKLADWAIRKLAEEDKERNRLITLAQEQIEDLEARIEEINHYYDNRSKFLKGHLQAYFTTVPHKQTKTQETYKLLSGSLVMKKQTSRINHNDEKLLSYLEENDGEIYIKLKKSVDWAEFKKNLVIQDGKVIDKELGTVMDNDVCSVEDVPASFDIKF